MGTVTYIGSEDPTEDRVCAVFGHTFEVNEPTEVPDEVAAKLTGNIMFTVGGGEGGELSAMTVVELKALARKRGVDLGDAIKKADVIAALELAAEDEGEGA